MKVKRESQIQISDYAKCSGKAVAKEKSCTESRDLPCSKNSR